MKRNIIGGNLNLPQVDWKGTAEGSSFTQAFINRLVLDNVYSQVVGNPTRGASLLEVYLVRPESALNNINSVLLFTKLLFHHLENLYSLG
jgi:hypothetical protein